MKNRNSALAVLAAVVVFGLGVPVSAQQEVSVEWTGGATATYGSEYAGIYSADISPISGSTVTSGMICDDYKDTVTNGETWKANAYQASSLASGNLANTMFGREIGLDGYAQLAALVSIMFGDQTFNGKNVSGISQSDIAAAIWYITSPHSISLDKNAKYLVSLVTSAFSGNSTTKAANYLATLTNLWILTPETRGKGEAQEMWVSVAVPEGGAALMYLLLSGITCLGAMFIRSKRQASGSLTI